MASDPVKVVLVEDDAELASLIGDYLAENGIEVHVVDDGADAMDAVARLDPALVILDQMLPNRDGLEICRELRPAFSGPIMFLTARSGWVDEVVGLELGADDYLGKPVEPRLLLARVRSLLRRSEAEPRQAVAEPRRMGLQINPKTREARLETRLLELTDAEFDMLSYLMEHAGEPLTRDKLSRDVCGVRYDGLDRTIDVRIGRLRAKLNDDPKRPRWIKSIRGVGYMFVPQDEEE